MSNSKNTDVVPVEDNQPMALSELGITVTRDPEQIAARLYDRLGKAETLDQMFDVMAGNTSDKLAGRTVEVLSVEWDAYQADQGVIPLAIVQAVDKADGRPLEFASTGGMLTRFIRNCEVRGLLPFTAKIEAVKTSSGQTALNFVRP